MSNSENDVSMTPSTSKSTEDESAVGVISSTTSELKSQDVCIAEGCNNAAVQHAEWDNEYCSVSCTYKHCKATFLDWLASNQKEKETQMAADQVTQDSPVKPNEEQPTTPNEEQPTTTNEEQPTTSNEEHPTTSNEEHPTTSNEEHPTTSNEEHPTTPNEEHPSTPNEEQPTTPNEEQPTTT